MIGDRGKGIESMGVGGSLGIHDEIKLSGNWKIEKYLVQVRRDVAGELAEFWNEIKNERLKPHEVLESANLMLNSGLQELHDILKGTSAFLIGESGSVIK